MTISQNTEQQIQATITQTQKWDHHYFLSLMSIPVIIHLVAHKPCLAAYLKYLKSHMFLNLNLTYLLLLHSVNPSTWKCYAETGYL